MSVPTKLDRAALANLLLVLVKFSMGRHQEAEEQIKSKGPDPKRLGREDAFREVINFTISKLREAGISDPMVLARIANNEEEKKANG